MVKTAPVSMPTDTVLVPEEDNTLALQPGSDDEEAEAVPVVNAEEQVCLRSKICLRMNFLQIRFAFLHHTLRR